jgi:uncharacterized membrane protein (UPF0127 family)
MGSDSVNGSRGALAAAGVVGGVKDRSQPRRFCGLPTTELFGRRVPIAATRVSRLLGLALLDRADAGPGLLIPRCRCVHTFGMRFPLDLVFLDQSARPLTTRRGVPPRRVAVERRARAVLELPTAGEAA